MNSHEPYTRQKHIQTTTLKLVGRGGGGGPDIYIYTCSKPVSILEVRASVRFLRPWGSLGPATTNTHNGVHPVYVCAYAYFYGSRTVNVQLTTS